MAFIPAEARAVWTPTAPALAHLTLDLAGVAIRLRSACADWIQAARLLWGGFETNEEPRIDLEFTLDDGVSTARGGDGGSARDLRTSLEGSAFRFELNEYRATVDLATGRGQLAGPSSPVPFALLWRYLLPVVADDLLVLHACALVEAERGYLGCGPSGVGKSTLAALFPGRALCDELVAIRRADVFTIHSLPYGIARSGAARLAAMYFLKQSPGLSRRRLSPSSVLQQLASLVVWPVISQAAMKRTLGLVDELVESVPAFELGFALDSNVWDLIVDVAPERS